MGFPEKLRAWMSLVRIGNSLIVGFAALVGYRVCGGNLLDPRAWIMFIAATIIGAGTYAINDYFDREVDAINKPWRPIPSGLVSARTAYIASISMLCIGTALSLAITPLSFVIAALASILAYAYSWKLKRLLIVGNLTVSFSAALSLVYGGAATPNPVPALVPALYAFLINLGREFLKGIEDVEGDRAYGVETLATRFGTRVAYVASLVVLAALIAISPLPFVVLGYSILYLIVAILGVDVPSIVALSVARSLDPRKAWEATRIMKIPLFLGLVAFFIG